MHVALNPFHLGELVHPPTPCNSSSESSQRPRNCPKAILLLVVTSTLLLTRTWTLPLVLDPNRIIHAPFSRSWNHLIQDWNHVLHRSKAQFYHVGNKVGSLLARQLKIQHLKMRIHRLADHTSHASVEHPQEIAYAFINYYSSLYNLAHDPSTPQPTPDIIASFLKHINLPSIDPAGQTQMSCPFYCPRNRTGHSLSSA